VDVAALVGVAAVVALFFCRKVLLTLTELNRLRGAWAVAESEAEVVEDGWTAKGRAGVGPGLGPGDLSTASKAEACAGGETGGSGFGAEGLSEESISAISCPKVQQTTRRVPVSKRSLSQPVSEKL
jgi:hypothetical protein